MRETEKLLVTSNFSFSHIVFKRLILQTHKHQGLFGKGLILAQTTKNWSQPNWTHLQITNHFIFRGGENIVGKEENAGYQHFLLFLQCFQKPSFPVSLTHNPDCYWPCEMSLLKTLWGRRENAGNQHFLLFPQCFLSFPIKISIFQSPWSSANAFNLGWSKILSFGTE